MARNTKSQGVSLLKSLLKAGQRKAKAEHRSFSNYVQCLIAADLAQAAGNQPKKEK